MKRLLLLFLVSLAVLLPAMAQNANRSGFFLDAAVGAAFGKTPKVAYSVSKEGDVSILFAHGPAWDFGFGYRLRTSNHFAYEFKVEAQSTFSYIFNAGLLKAFPLSLRYTSNEISRNISLYLTGGLGMCLGPRSCVRTNISYNPAIDYKRRAELRDVTAGIAYTLGFGVNLNTHLSMGLLLDAQFMFINKTRVGKESYNWGISGLNVAYRF